MNDTYQSWLDNLQPQDTVILVHYAGKESGLSTIEIVESVTLSEIVVRQIKYSRSNGKYINTLTGDAIQLQAATPARVAIVQDQIHHRQILSDIKAVNWNGVHINVLEVVWAALEPSLKGQQK